MHQIAEYIISVSAAAFLCGILNSMMLKGTAKEVVKLVSGLFLAFCVISPVSRIQLPELSDLETDLRQEAEQAVREGEELAEDTLRESITQQLEAYILDKAQAMKLDITAEVFLTREDGYYPEAVFITGTASTVKRQQFIQEIAEDLGITKEDITWTQVS